MLLPTPLRFPEIEGSGSAAQPEQEHSDDGLNLKQVALRLGLHYMTVYRYVRQGRLEAQRSGTEWRVSEQAVEELLHGRRDAAEKGPASSSSADWSLRMERCLLAGDETAAWRVVEEALAAAHPVDFCYIEVLAAALSSVGTRWEQGQLSVADQHIAVAVAWRIVARLGARVRRPGRSKGCVVLGAPHGELHSLPVSIVADLMRMAGFDALELGANVPTEAFALAALRTPRLLAIGVGISDKAHLGVVQEVVDALSARAASVPVVVGGLGVLDPGAAALRGVSALFSDGRAAVRFVCDLSERRRNQATKALRRP
jgi:MerR family transcriptional regulator, light-induced transcriptional regulator